MGYLPRGDGVTAIVPLFDRTKVQDMTASNIGCRKFMVGAHPHKSYFVKNVRRNEA